jgi:hypothetical protein
MELVSVQELEGVVGGVGTFTVTNNLTFSLEQENNNHTGSTTANAGSSSGGAVAASAPGPVSQVNYFALSTWLYVV